MNIAGPEIPGIIRQFDYRKKTKINSVETQKKFVKKDIVLNVSLRDALIRFGIMIVLPILILIIDKHLVIYTAPIMTYLFVSAITHFCAVKYVWQHYLQHKALPPLPAYGENPDYPEESI
jgi:hypothetical protein